MTANTLIMIVPAAIFIVGTLYAMSRSARIARQARFEMEVILLDMIANPEDDIFNLAEKARSFREAGDILRDASHTHKSFGDDMAKDMAKGVASLERSGLIRHLGDSRYAATDQGRFVLRRSGSQEIIAASRR